jgi:hypothetical protein
MLTDAQIRTRLAEIIRGVAASALVIERWIQDVDDDEWGRLLHNSEGRIYAWMVDLEGIPEIERQATRRQYTFRYIVQGYRFFESGTTASNSSTTWNTEVLEICRAVNADHRIGLNDPSLKEVGLLTFGKLAFTNFGRNQCHYARGAITVKLVEN